MILDNFLDTYPLLKDAALHGTFEGVVNPDDGLLYPHITLNIPRPVRDEVAEKLTLLMGEPVDIKVQFMRMTNSETDRAPHQAHNDALMSKYLLLIYTNDGPGGTSFVRHKETGLEGEPETQDEFDAWIRDANVPDAWEITDMIEMKQNRAAIIPAERMHRAEPVGGFGKDTEDGRIVMMTFFT